MNKITLTIASLIAAVLIFAGFHFWGDDAKRQSHPTSLSPSGSMATDTRVRADKSVEQKSKRNQNHSAGQKSNSLVAEQPKRVDADKVHDRQSHSQSQNNQLALSEEDLIRLMGSEKELAWLRQYNQAKYSPEYDLTWQDDLYQRANELVISEKYADSLSLNNTQCEESYCKYNLTSINPNQSAPRLAAEFMLDLKDHPAIIESGKKRNVYLEFVGLDAEGNKVIILNAH